MPADQHDEEGEKSGEGARYPELKIVALALMLPAVALLLGGLIGFVGLFGASGGFMAFCAANALTLFVTGALLLCAALALYYAAKNA